jgi:hypothetical protein
MVFFIILVIISLIGWAIDTYKNLTNGEFQKTVNQFHAGIDHQNKMKVEKQSGSEKTYSKELAQTNHVYDGYSQEYAYRTKNQKKVKSLGYSLVEKTGSKRKAKDILVDKYGFDEDTAKFAAGYKGYENW